MFTNHSNFFKTCKDPEVLKCAKFFVEQTYIVNNITTALKKFGEEIVNKALFGKHDDSYIIDQRSKDYYLRVSAEYRDTYDTYNYDNNTIDCYSNCIDCYDCIKCHDCSNCVGCYALSYSTGCKGCVFGEQLSDCTNCISTCASHDCSNCYGIFELGHYSGCKECHSEAGHSRGCKELLCKNAQKKCRRCSGWDQRDKDREFVKTLFN